MPQLLCGPAWRLGLIVDPSRLTFIIVVLTTASLFHSPLLYKDFSGYDTDKNIVINKTSRICLLYFHVKTNVQHYYYTDCCFCCLAAIVMSATPQRQCSTYRALLLVRIFYSGVRGGSGRYNTRFVVDGSVGMSHVCVPPYDMYRVLTIKLVLQFCFHVRFAVPVRCLPYIFHKQPLKSYYVNVCIYSSE